MTCFPSTCKSHPSRIVPTSRSAALPRDSPTSTVTASHYATTLAASPMPCRPSAPFDFRNHSHCHHAIATAVKHIRGASRAAVVSVRSQGRVPRRWIKTRGTKIAYNPTFGFPLGTHQPKVNQVPYNRHQATLTC